jgi:hypothetical protein
VLDDLAAAATDYDGRHRRDIDGVGAVAAGADNVHGTAFDSYRRGVREHGSDHAGQLVGGLALRP